MANAAETAAAVAAVKAGLAAHREHERTDTGTCACGYEPTATQDWERHRDTAVLATVVDLTTPAGRLVEMSTAVSHCGQPMRYVSSHSSWQGTDGSGTAREEVLRRCIACPATLIVTFVEPS